MFKKLQLRLAIFSSILISLIFLLLLVIVNVTVLLSIEQSIDSSIEIIEEKLAMQENIITTTSNDIIPRNVIVIVVLLDQSSEITKTISNVNVIDEEVLDLIHISNRLDGEIEYKGTDFSYSKRVHPEYTSVTYYDITSEVEQLNFLRLASIFSFFAGSIFFISFTLLITKKTLKPAEDMFRKQQEFVANASHELKTPLSVMSANIDMISELSKDPNQQKWIQYLKDEVERLAQLSNRLLTLAEYSEVNNEVYIKSNLNILSIVKSQLVHFSKVILSKHIELSLEVNNTHILYFNEDLFKQLLRILLDNACKYTNDSGKILIKSDVNKKYTFLSISNTGSTISKEELVHIFDRFRMGDKSREADRNSFGLGLAIGKEIALLGDANLIVNSDSKNEITFTFRVNNY